MQTASQDTSSDFTQRLCQASIVGDLDGVQALLTDWLRCASNHRSPPDPEPLQTALEAAAKHNQVSIVAYLVKQGLSCDRSTVKAALEGGATDVLQAFLDHGWDINGSLGLGSGPALTTIRVLQNEHLLTWFLAHGASPNRPADTGRTALDAAAWHSSPAVVARLLQHGDTIETNALHMAVRSPRSGRYQVVEYLLNAGADVDAREYEGTERLSTRASSGLGTALHYAARKGREDLVRLLLERGASTEIRDTLGRTAADVAREAGHDNLIPALSIEERG